MSIPQTLVERELERVQHDRDLLQQEVLLLRAQLALACLNPVGRHDVGRPPVEATLPASVPVVATLSGSRARGV
jgi:hypothetical protein